MKRYSIIIAAISLCFQLFSQETINLEDQFLKNTRQLIYEGNRSGEGYFSDDGRYLIFQSEREEENPFYQIYILDFETGDINRVSPGHGKTTCAYFQWSGDRVMYASSHLDPDARKKQQEEMDFRATGQKKRYSWDYETSMDIFSANRDGSDIKQLTDEEGYDAEGSYSPDGKLIVYSTNKDAYNRKLSKEEQQKMEVDQSFFCDLYIMNADGSDKKKLTDTPGYDGGPFFSPDGERIIWRQFSEDGHAADVYTMNIDGSDVQRLTDFGCLSWAPYYHPSGDYIVWAANKEGYSNFEIYMTDVNGLKEPIRITYTDGFDGLPVFSPDGKKLVWTASRTADGKAQLFIANWNDEFAREQIAKAPYRESTQAILNSQFTSSNIETENKKSITDPVQTIGTANLVVDKNDDDLTSDVDKNIPINRMNKPNTYALIIGNEDYSSYQPGLNNEANADFALNDAKVFKEYCSKVLCIPDKQIKLKLNATLGQMKQGIAWLKNLAKIDNGKAELIFYYSGHGLPDEKTKEAFLIPVDISGNNPSDGIKLEDLYNKLTEYPLQKVTIFLDACFSGGARNQGLVAMKGLKVKPKENLISGNIVVFSSSSGAESSGVYREKQHGYMTYYLLKKIQESKGNVSYQELANYIINKVKRESALNGKIQTPQVIFSPTIENKWPNWSLK